MTLISKDGETWYEVADAEFRRLLDDPAVECWVDLSEGTMKGQMLMSALRALRDSEPQPVDWQGRPKELFGLPIIWEDA